MFTVVLETIFCADGFVDFYCAERFDGVDVDLHHQYVLI